MYRFLSWLGVVSLVLACAGAWAGCGSSSSTTDTTVPSDDAGGDDAGGDAGDDVSPTPVCTSGTNWTNGNRGSALMHPGRACIDCHTNLGGPLFSIGGTVYPSAHEPDDCNGANGTTLDLSVIITDAVGTVNVLKVNAAGNFYSQDLTIMTPIHAMVGQGCMSTMNDAGTMVTCAKQRGMVSTQNTGDCNSCHTVKGANLAPGRIQAP
jgi:hypothetical protein